MFSCDTRQQRSGVIHPGLAAGGAWLGGMSLFAGLLWLSSLMPARPPAAEKPAARAPAVSAPAVTPLEPEIAPAEPACAWSSDDVIPFGVSMTRPEFLSGQELVHTPEARAAGVQGVIIARCTLTCRGDVRDCRILKPLPHMEQAALTVLESRLYKPVQYLGRPITVSYVFALRLAAPERPPDNKQSTPSLSRCGVTRPSR